MRIILVSDIHSNAVALDAVLAVLPEHDALWCLGDTIGYGPEPNLCLTRMQSLAAYALTGNHDLASVGEISLEYFNPVARVANTWNNAQLEPELRQWLQTRPARLDLDMATLAHASPRDPIWEYVLDQTTAHANLAYFNSNICFIGHSHVPLIFAQPVTGDATFSHAPAGRMLALKDQVRYILNPGSIGQPRDGDPRAAYALWDTEARTIRWERVPYDIAATQKQMRAVKLPEVLAERLAYGR